MQQIGLPISASN